MRAEVVSLDVFSAHADQGELLARLGAAGRPPRRVFVTDGEPVAADALRHQVEERLGFGAVVAEHHETVELG